MINHSLPNRRIIVFLVALMALSPLWSGAAEVRKLLSRDLHDLGDKTGDILLVEFAPGESSPPHRHKAHTFVYVLAGSVIMQVQGGEAVSLRAGQTFYENPDDIHLVSRNASDTEPAKLLVFSVREKGAPPSVPVK